ncbi:nicotinate-nicotinamide nucleotide adenylyltransferase [Candidatus Tenderia electrophaga]|uniref:Probable nicotinate-nucleotide adenylyltransferase n=1 Tax=Candidatus Tenderia electrophaga TaxID=1748243 RepID=A0A0S2TA56_9GAMM|nr:nicotinate-nicotinamide nucleotide adenylyltransferase [Candidatus Tenderia electrophaga]
MIALFGGTFDPVHYGHLRPLLEVKQALALNQVRLIPAFIPPHRDTPGAEVTHRLAMLRLGVAQVPGFVIDERELRRGGRSYSVDTLQSLRDEIGAATPLCLIMGLDAFAGLASWHEWQRLTELAHLVIAQRPGAELPGSGPVAELMATARARHAAELQQQPAGKLWFQEVTQLEISATAIRAERARGGDIRFLVPDSVRQYIETRGLYQHQEG